MTGRSYEPPDDITTLGGMVIFVLINTDIWGARPRGFRIPKLSQVRVLTRFYTLVPLLPYLNPQVSNVFNFVVLTGQHLPQLDPKTVPRCYRSRQRGGPFPTSISICNIFGPKNLLTVTDRDRTPTSEPADEFVDVAGSPLVCRWRELRGCLPHCRRAGGVQAVG